MTETPTEQLTPLCAGPTARRLYAKAVFTGYERGHRTQREDTSLMKLDKIFPCFAIVFFFFWGRIRDIWGHVKLVLGNVGVVPTKCHYNSRPTTMGKRIWLVLGSTIFLFVDIAEATPIQTSQTFFASAVQFCTVAIVVAFIMYLCILYKKIRDIRKEILAKAIVMQNTIVTKKDLAELKEFLEKY